jgi:predicted RNA-binding protein with PUA-like domain
VAKKATKSGGWLFKEDPGCYTYDNLEKDGVAMWTGVHNPLARKHLRNVKAGDRVLYYHTGSERAIVGEMLAVADASSDSSSSDPKAVAVKVKPVKRWNPPVKLEEIKQDSLFAEWELVRISRLSVMPVSPERWQRLEQMRDENASGNLDA